ncbi:hypothetical protein BHE74_00046362, partial [Ensete ventricosum]
SQRHSYSLLLLSFPPATMAKHLFSTVAVVFAVACVLPALAIATRDVGVVKLGFVVQGRVFCDTCRAGFETPASTYIQGEGFTAPHSRLPIFFFCWNFCRRILPGLGSMHLQTSNLETLVGMVECRSEVTGAKTCSFEGTTDHTGTYNILVADEHDDHEICESLLISSPESGCNTALQGRERAPVFLSHNNGIASGTRFANSLGFLKDTSLPGCSELLKSYEQYED